MWYVTQKWKGKTIRWGSGHSEKDLYDFVQYMIDSILPEYITSFTIINNGTGVNLETYRRANNIRKRSPEERWGVK